MAMLTSGVMGLLTGLQASQYGCTIEWAQLKCLPPPNIVLRSRLLHDTLV
jgi:hypothetical protein